MQGLTLPDLSLDIIKAIETVLQVHGSQDLHILDRSIDILLLLALKELRFAEGAKLMVTRHIPELMHELMEQWWVAASSPVCTFGNCKGMIFMISCMQP